MDAEVWSIGLALGCLALAIYYYGFRGLSFFSKHGIPHKRPYPFVGNMGPVMFGRKSMAHLIQDIYNIHPDAKYVGMYDFLNPVIVVRDPELIKTITVKCFDSFPDHRSFVHEEVDPLFGKNLFLLKGERWRYVRYMLSPAFTSSKMKSMFKLMYKVAEDFTSYLAETAEKRERENPMEMKQLFMRYTNDVIATCAFGLTIDSVRNPDNKFYVLGKSMTVFDTWRTLKVFFIVHFPNICKWLRVKLVKEYQSDYFTNIISSTIDERSKLHITRPDMIQLMMDSNEKTDKTDFSMNDMVAQAFIFFFGGFETSSALMSFAAHEVAVNPEIQERLRDEVKEVLDSSGNCPTYEDIIGMKYLDAVISEALRMYPIGVLMDRVCASDFELPPTLPGAEKFVVKKNKMIWFPFYGLHRDSAYFENPDKFDPERFLGDKSSGSGNPAYMPFGQGPRMCIGNRFALLQTKVLLLNMIAKCRLAPCAKMRIPLVLSKAGVAMQAEGGFWLDVSLPTR